jgi:hypothetical protein
MNAKFGSLSACAHEEAKPLRGRENGASAARWQHASIFERKAYNGRRPSRAGRAGVVHEHSLSIDPP